MPRPWRRAPATRRRGTALIGLVTAGVLAGASPSGARAPSPASTPAPRVAAVQARACGIRARYPQSLAVRSVRILHGPVVVAPVCFGRRGPYPFLIDTGAARSLVTPALAHRLGLVASGPSGFAAGLKCRARVVPSAVAAWSLGGAALGPGTVLVGALPRLPVRIDGIVGSDELSRFGEIAIDYARGRLVLASSPRAGARGGTSARLRAREVRLRARLSLVRAGQAVVAEVRVDFAGHAADLVVDTGAALSAVSSSLARRASLAAAPGDLVLAAFGCPVRVAQVRSGRWSLGGVVLSRRTLAVLPAGGIDAAGLLGADVLSSAGTAIVDYAGGRLLLER